MKRRDIGGKTDHELLVAFHEELKWHRYILLAILAGLMSGVRLFDVWGLFHP